MDGRAGSVSGAGTQDAEPKPNALKSAVLEELFTPTDLQSVDIIAVHDIWQSVETAWSFGDENPSASHKSNDSVPVSIEVSSIPKFTWVGGSSKSDRDVHHSMKQDKNEKVGTWLSDPAMFVTDVCPARVFALSYTSPEQPSSTEHTLEKPDLNASFKETLTSAATALLSQIGEKRSNTVSHIPLILIGSGFGCIIMQKLIGLVAEDEDHLGILDAIAGVVFFDAPNPVGTDPATTVEEDSCFPPVANTGRAATATKAFLESNVIDSRSLWLTFNYATRGKGISTIWFYAFEQAVEQPSWMVSNPSYLVLNSQFADAFFSMNRHTQLALTSSN